MTEQNAHDDERDTADLATNDAADLAAGDATDLVTDDTADLAIDDTSDSAVGDTADLATADAARSQAPAGQLTPAGRAVSPSPSPTPTFAATDRPARRARRLRWKPGITRPMMALSAASFALMIAGVGGYVSAIPAVVADDRHSAVIIPLESALWLDGQMREVQVGPVGSTRGGPGDDRGLQDRRRAPDAAAALGLGSGSGSGMLGVASLTGASAASSVDSSFTRAQQIAGASAASGSGSVSGPAASGGSSQAGSGSAGSGSASGSGSGSGNSGGSGGASGDVSGSGSGSEGADGSGSAPAPAGPTAEQEAAAYAVLVDHQARVNDYVARVNNAVAAFNNDCMSTSRPLRQSDYNECAAIDSQTLTDFLLLRNSNAFAEGSRWQEQKGNLQRAYIALDQYLSVIYDAWGLNLAYENPAEGVDRWMEPVRADQDASGNSIAAARLNETLASIRL